MLHYTLTLPDHVQHLLDIELTIDEITTPTIEVVLPTWTPGSYLIREYARHLQEFQAVADDAALPWEKTEKARWRITTQGASTITVRYRVYGNELTVRTNHVDATHAHVIPAATFVYAEGRQAAALQVTVMPPLGWGVATGLDAQGDGPWPGPGPATFDAPNYDALVDAPFEIGTHRSLPFFVNQTPHRIVLWSAGNEDAAQLVADTQRIVETERDFWGDLPYAHYTFFLLLGGKGAGGGLEHQNSTSLILPRGTFRPAKSYERFLGLTCHEFFHTWNVKRLRAQGLGPFDYTKETYTPLLWAMEGHTEYYTDLLLVRAGLLTPQRYLERLADDIVSLQSTPGRRLHSLAMSSWDAWIKHYRPDENTPNTTISYYLKGGLVALLLDLHLRQQTTNAVSLDDVLRRLYQQFPISGPGVSEASYLDAIHALTGLDVAPFFARYIRGTDELPFDDALAAAGIALRWGHKHLRDDGTPRPTLGIRTKDEHGQLRVVSVLSDGGAAGTGLAAQDEIVAVNGVRVTDAAALNDCLDNAAVGDTLALTVFRSDLLQTVAVTLDVPPYDALTLVLRPDATPEQVALRTHWLGPLNEQ